MLLPPLRAALTSMEQRAISAPNATLLYLGQVEKRHAQPVIAEYAIGVLCVDGRRDGLVTRQAKVSRLHGNDVGNVG